MERWMEEDLKRLQNEQNPTSELVELQLPVPEMGEEPIEENTEKKPETVIILDM